MWWRQAEVEKQLRVTLEDILETARVRCWESGRCGKCGEGREVAESDSGIDGPRYDGMGTGDS